MTADPTGACVSCPPSGHLPGCHAYGWTATLHPATALPTGATGAEPASQQVDALVKVIVEAYPESYEEAAEAVLKAGYRLPEDELLALAALTRLTDQAFNTAEVGEGQARVKRDHDTVAAGLRRPAVPTPLDATGATGAERVGAWMRKEYERAKKRNALIPPHARLVITRQPSAEAESYGCRCGHPGAGCICRKGY